MTPVPQVARETIAWANGAFAVQISTTCVDTRAVKGSCEILNFTGSYNQVGQSDCSTHTNDFPAPLRTGTFDTPRLVTALLKEDTHCQCASIEIENVEGLMDTALGDHAPWALTKTALEEHNFHVAGFSKIPMTQMSCNSTRGRVIIRAWRASGKAEYDVRPTSSA